MKKYFYFIVIMFTVISCGPSAKELEQRKYNSLFSELDSCVDFNSLSAIMGIKTVNGEKYFVVHGYNSGDFLIPIIDNKKNYQIINQHIIDSMLIVSYKKENELLKNRIIDLKININQLNKQIHYVQIQN